MFYRSLFGLCLAVGILFALPTQAAKLVLVAETSTINVDEPFTATLVIDSEGTPINAAQASMIFDPQLLEVVQINKDTSIFNFWLQEPIYSNDNGTLSFIGGSLEGFSGKSLQLFTLTLKAKKTGEITLDFTDGAINANDGSGANILNTLTGLRLSGSTSSTTPNRPVQQIIRKATPSGSLPTLPKITVPLYPDPQKWYGQLSPFLVRWDLPPDVTAVSAVLNQDPVFTSKTAEGLFDNKTFVIPRSGIWYIHVSFKNSLGWGKTAHYRIAIDTIPPATFQIRILEGTKTDDPRPTIAFETRDPITDIKQYGVRVDDKDIFYTQENQYHLPLLKPGKHRISVSASDQAENATEAHIEINIQPLPAPTITLSTTEYTIGRDNSFHILGTGLPGQRIHLHLKNEAHQYLESYQAAIDEKGNWSFAHDHLPREGTYKIEAIQEDERGATSLPIETDSIIIRRAWNISALPVSTVAVLLCIALVFLILSIIFERFSRKTKNSYRQSPRILENQFKTLLEETRVDLNAIAKHMRSPEKKQLFEKLIASLNTIHLQLENWRDRLEKK